MTMPLAKGYCSDDHLGIVRYFNRFQYIDSQIYIEGLIHIHMYSAWLFLRILVVDDGQGRRVKREQSGKLINCHLKSHVDFTVADSNCGKVSDRPKG